MKATLDSTHPVSERNYRRVGAAVLATLLLAGVMLGASFSVFGHGKGAVASASVRVPHALTGASLLVLTIPGIAGESLVPGHPGGIDVQSFSWGVQNSATALKSGISGAGKVNFQDLTLTKLVDSASPALFQACASRTLIPAVQFAVLPSADVTSTRDRVDIKLSNVFVASCSDSGAAGGGAEESISLNFAKITFDYKPQGAASAKHMGWDLKKGTKV